MGAVIRFVRTVIVYAIYFAMFGTLLEMTGLVGREAVKAHQHGGISFKWLNDQLNQK